MPESFLIKCQTEGLQPCLKRDFDADFFPVNVEQARRNGKNSGGRGLEVYQKMLGKLVS